MKKLDPLDLENLRLPDSFIPTRRVPGTVVDRLEKEKEARKKKRFVKLYLVWDDYLNGLGVKAQIVARHILRLHFENHGKPFILTNSPLLAKGVDREMKRLAVAQLERDGMIEVTRRPNRNPIIRPLHV
jgi:hypothetical protein